MAECGEVNCLLMKSLQKKSREVKLSGEAFFEIKKR